MKLRIKYLVTLIFLWNLGFAGIVLDGKSKKQSKKYADKTEFNCIGKIFQNEIFVGSCVLISNKIVLSAAHVFITHEFRTDTIQMNGQIVIANVPISNEIGDIHSYQLIFGNKKYKIEKIKMYEQYINAGYKGDADIALVELTESVSNVENANLANFISSINDTITSVGYGPLFTINESFAQSLYKKQIKNAGNNIIDSLGGEIIVDHPTKIYTDLDCNHLSNKKSNPNDIAYNIEYLPTGGDSGGGLFEFRNGKYYLIGLCSGTFFDIKKQAQSGYCGQIGIYTSLLPFKLWISDYIKKDI
jgi:hypothetical protein